MELYDYLRKIAFVFFVILGLGHFLSGLFYVNGYYVVQSGMINRVTFIPFVLCAITYAFASIKYRLIALTNKDSKTLTYIMLASGILIFLGLLFIELFVLDSPTPLIL